MMIKYNKDRTMTLWLSEESHKLFHEAILEYIEKNQILFKTEEELTRNINSI